MNVEWFVDVGNTGLMSHMIIRNVFNIEIKCQALIALAMTAGIGISK